MGLMGTDSLQIDCTCLVKANGKGCGFKSITRAEMERHIIKEHYRQNIRIHAKRFYRVNHPELIEQSLLARFAAWLNKKQMEKMAREAVSRRSVLQNDKPSVTPQEEAKT